jgi:hypothetical protein
MNTDDRTYGEACAEVYDQWFGSCEEAAVDLLAELATWRSRVSSP